MSDDVGSLDAYEGNFEYSHLGGNYGNPMLNMMMHGLFGFNQRPRPTSGQSMHDALIQQERSKSFMKLQHSAFGNSNLMQRLGMDNTPMSNVLGGALGSPGGMMANMMSPLQGGNPMAATMQIYAGMSGANVMGNFGRTGEISENETRSTMEALNKNFYASTAYEGKGGGRESSKKDTQDFIRSRAKEGKTGLAYLKDMGLDLSVDQHGNLTAESEERVKNFDITPGTPETSGARSARVSKSDDQRKKYATEMTDYIEGNKYKAGSTPEEEKIRLEKKARESKVLEKSMRDSGMYSEDQLASLKDENGVITKTKKLKSMSENVAANKPAESESEDATNLRNRIAGRKFVATDLMTELDKTLTETDKDKQKALKDVLVERLKKDAKFSEEQIKNIKDDKGNLKADEIRSGLTEFSAGGRDHFERKYIKDQRDAERGKTYQGFQFQNTRGFKLEDFTSGFYKASELRMMGDKRGVSMSSAMDDFSKNAGGAMSAARSLYGSDKSGGELMEKMSKLVGSQGVDLSTKGGSEQMEDLLRKVKSTARVAGVSIKTMLGIIDATKELAANSPQLQHMNSAATTNIALNAVTKASSIGGAMSGKDYRAAGGSQGMASREANETLAFTQSNLGGFQAGLASLAMGSKDPKEAMRQLKEMRDAGDLTGTGLQNGGLTKVAKMLGMSETAVSYQASMAEFQQRGLKNAEVANFVSGEEGGDATILKTYNEGAATHGLDSIEELGKQFKEAEKLGMDEDTFFNTRVQGKQNTAAGIRFVNQYKGKIMAGVRNSTRNKEDIERVNDAIKKGADEEKKTAQEMDQYMAPALTNIYDALSKGKKLDLEEVSKAVTGTFATGKFKDKNTQEARNAVQGLQGASEAAMQGAELVGSNKGDQGLLDAGMTDILNKMAKGRKVELAASDDPKKREAAAEMTAEGTADDVKNAINAAKTFDSTDAAKRRLSDLEEQNSKKEFAKGSLEAQQLSGLKYLKGHRLLASQSAMNFAKKGVRGMYAAEMEAERQEKIDSQTKEIATQKVENLGDKLAAMSSVRDDETGQLAPEAELAKTLRETYAVRDEKGEMVKDEKGDIKVDTQRMFKDWQKPEGTIFADENMKKRLEQSRGIGAAFNQTETDITEAQKKAAVAGGGEEDKKDPISSLNDTVGKLIEAINTGGIATSLSSFANALLGVKT